MKRLTMYTSSGDLSNIVVVDGKAVEKCLEFAQPLQRLAGYEDTGLTPEQIREMTEAKTTDEISKKHVRLTKDKDVSEMSMVELAHNCCYAKDGKARYRDYDSDTDARELAIKLLDRYANVPNEFTCDEDFDDFMLAIILQYGLNNMIGLIAAFYQNLWAMADLRERLKEYEDLEEQGKLLKLPCAVGDTVYCIMTSIKGTKPTIFSQKFDYSMIESFGKAVFLSREEAENALKEEEGCNE